MGKLSAGPKTWPSIAEVVEKLLTPPDKSTPVFWVDSAGTFVDVYQQIGTDETVPLDTRSALRLRLKMASEPSCSRTRFYVRSEESLEPIEELVQCFGHTVRIELRDVMQRQGWSVSDEAIQIARKSGLIYVRRVDAVPSLARAEGKLKKGLAASILEANSIDIVELAAAYLRKLSFGSEAYLTTASFEDATAERSLVQEVIGDELGIPVNANFDDNFFRRLIVADTSAIAEFSHVAAHLNSTSDKELNKRLIDRISLETIAVRRIRDMFEQAVSGLGINVATLTPEILLCLRLVPGVEDAAAEKISERLQTVDPERAFEILLEFEHLVATRSGALQRFATALMFWRHLDGAVKRVAECEGDMDAFCRAYVGSWYLIDHAYRAAMSTAGGNLKLALQSYYRRWIRDENVAFSSALESHSSWVFDKAQRKLGKALCSVAEGTAIIVCDALRYELAIDVVAPLGRDATIERDWAISSLPSITEVGMSALVPSMEQLNLEVENGDLHVYVGDRETTNKSARTAIWQKAGFKVVEPADAPVISPDAKKIVIFHGAVDALGEKLQSESFMHFSVLARELSQLIRTLVKKGLVVHVVADHGFLTLPPSPSNQSVIGPTQDDDVKKRRYRVSTAKQINGPIISRSATQLGFAGNVSVDFPPAVSIYSAHGALTFLHGGLSLQELIIPYFTLRPKVKPVQWNFQIPKSVRARIVRLKGKADRPLSAEMKLEVTIWRADEIVGRTLTIIGPGTEQLTLSCDLVEKVTPGRLRITVGYPGQVPLSDEILIYEPDR